MILSGTSGHPVWQRTRCAAAILPVLAVILLVSGCQGLPHSRGTLTPRGQSPDYTRDIQQEYGELPSSGAPIRQGPSGPELLGDEAAQGEQIVDNTLVDIRIEGNDTIETGAVMAYVKSQVGRPPNERQIKEDLRSLYATKWFFSVERRYRMTERGLALVFRVLERPVVRSVVIKGNENFPKR
ncbi:MAG: hypothetical protein ACI93T_004781, partial [Porticoccaceae bacterium]